MTAKNLRPVALSKLLALVTAAGLTVEEQSAFYKVDVSGRRCYIAKTKMVSRIDVSGFEPDVPGVTPLTEQEAKELRLGKVRGQVDFTKDEADVLEAFEMLLGEIKDGGGKPLSSEVRKQEAKRAAEAKKAERLAAIAAAAQAKKTPPASPPATEQDAEETLNAMADDSDDDGDDDGLDSLEA